MKTYKNLSIIAISVAFFSLFSCYVAADPINSPWEVVVNNSFIVPGDTRSFNSYNQPSLSMDGFVVFRARSKAGGAGEPAHGIFTRDMHLGLPLRTMFDRNMAVPQPNNLGSTFTEPPAFPRIDMQSHTIASRGNHQPVWRYIGDDGTETRAGTTGIYTDPFGVLMTGASNLGAVPGFQLFSVPGTDRVKFDVFPGAPAVTAASTIVFKGNYTVPDPDNPGETISKTGVYYRDLFPGPVPSTMQTVLIANSDTMIPGSTTPFGSTAPPSAAGRYAVFSGFDNEDAPALGGIYLTSLSRLKPAVQTLNPLVKIGGQVPGEAKGTVFNKIGEGLSFDGRFVGFWGAWGTDTRTITLQCPTTGNRDLIAYCNEQYPNGYTTTVPIHQGIFVHDIQTRVTTPVTKTPDAFDDCLFWNFSGKVPGSGDDGEPARWRSAAFVAVSGIANQVRPSGNRAADVFYAVFKATSGVRGGQPGDAVDGLYLRKAPGNFSILPLVETGMDGTLIDPAAVDPETQAPLPVTAMGVERDGFRGSLLAITVTMGTEEAGWAGIYMTRVSDGPTK
jgi:hypothetical protein